MQWANPQSANPGSSKPRAETQGQGIIYSPASFYREHIRPPRTQPRPPPASTSPLSRAFFRGHKVKPVNRSSDPKQASLLARHGIHAQRPPAPAHQHRPRPAVLRRQRERDLQVRSRRYGILANKIKSARRNIAQMRRARLRKMRRPGVNLQRDEKLISVCVSTFVHINLPFKVSGARTWPPPSTDSH